MKDVEWSLEQPALRRLCGLAFVTVLALLGTYLGIAAGEHPVRPGLLGNHHAAPRLHLALQKYLLTQPHS